MSSLIALSISHAQSSDPVAVVQRQLDTYNAHDLEGFVSTFAPNAEVFINLGDSVAGMTGREEIKEIGRAHV